MVAATASDTPGASGGRPGAPQNSGGHPQPPEASATEASGGARAALLRAVALFALARGLTACTTMLCAAVLRYHIVVWALVAPKFVFEVFMCGACYLGLAVAVIACGAL